MTGTVTGIAIGIAIGLAIVAVIEAIREHRTPSNPDVLVEMHKRKLRGNDDE